VTSPLQPAPDGAFVIGGGDYQFGQDYTDSIVKQIFHIPTPTLSNAIDLLQEFLLKMPIEALRAFKDLIPGTVDDDFLDVLTAVDTIIDKLQLSPAFLAVNDFTSFLTTLLTNPGAVLGTIGQDLVDGLEGALSWLNSATNQIIDIFNGLVVTPISTGIANVKDWFDSIGEQFTAVVDDAQDFVDKLFGGFSGIFGIGKSKGDVANAATGVAGTAADARSLGEWNNALLGIRNNKSIMTGIDETEESTFLLSDLLTGAADPPSINATSSSYPLAFWRATENAKKGFVSWLGKGITSVTAIHVDIYKLNFDTSQMVLIHSSANLVGSASGSWSYIVYNLPVVNRFDVAPGEVFGFALRVVGAGTHQIAGKSASWFPAHPSVVPAKPAATTSGTPGNVAFGSIVYSGNTPWYGIGIVEGDTPPPFNAPRTFQFTTAGANTFNIPAWANFIDVISLGGGGGGGSSNAAATGQGGAGGAWNTTTLTRGVQFKSDLTTMTATVGAGGNGGGAVVFSGNNGTSGAASTLAYLNPSSSTVTFTAAGGGWGGQAVDNNGAIPGGISGKSPGNTTYLGTEYYGGASASAGNSANGPGGGGPGGQAFKGGRDGAKGTIILVARQL
jgi:hypothetical protein